MKTITTFVTNSLVLIRVPLTFVVIATIVIGTFHYIKLLFN
jgi:uncharacterized membrane protein